MMKRQFVRLILFLCSPRFSQLRLCRVLEFDDGIYGHYLDVVPLHLFSAMWEAECALKCHTENRCRAFNFYAKNGDEKECQILDTDRVHHSRRFSTNPGYIYREVKKTCDGCECVHIQDKLSCKTKGSISVDALPTSNTASSIRVSDEVLQAIYKKIASLTKP